jgi:pyridoxine 5-phosphate synthase
MSQTIHLGVNIDHIATVRQARGERYPSPLYGALLAQHHGADSITLHLREDRRHIQDADVLQLLAASEVKTNLEMAATSAMIEFACTCKPQACCLVPEKREELTTEGGLDVVGQTERLREAIKALQQAGICVSLFIDPERAQIDAACALGAEVVELHTGRYAEAHGSLQTEELMALQQAAVHAYSLGLRVHAGHGLHYHNVQAVAAIPELEELNIGHAIVAEALFIGLPEAVARMKALMVAARGL